MSDILDLLDQVENPGASIYRELYIKRQFLSGGSLDYETDWAQISSKRVKSWGSVEAKAEGVNNYQDRLPSLRLTFENFDGYFDNVDVTNSVFFGAYNRQRTMIKIDVGYRGADRLKLPDNDTAFVGIIGGDVEESSDGEISFEVSGFEDVFRSVQAEDVGGLFTEPTSTSDNSNWNLFRAIQEHTDGAGNALFTPYFPLNNWIVEPSNRQFKTAALDTSGVDGLTVWEFMQKMAQACDMRFSITRQGKVFFGQNDIDDYLSEATGAVDDTDCLFHASLSDTLVTEIAGTTALTCTSATPAYAAGYHSTGFLSDLSGTSFLEVQVNTFNPQRFCVEFWYVPQNFGISGGSAPESIAMMEITVAAFQGYVGMTDEIRIGFGTYHGNSAGSALGIGKQMGLSGTMAFCECSAAAAVDITAGQAGFFAFVHDINGIGGTDDVFRIYHGTAGADTPALVASSTMGSDPENNAGDALACVLGDNNETFRNFRLLPLSAGSATGPSVIDNVKIYGYAKTDFSDFKTEDGYFKKQKYFVQGPGDAPGARRENVIGDVVITEAIDKVFNRVEIEYSGASAIEEETFARGDSSSSDMYGVRTFKTKIGFIGTEAGSVASELYDRFKDPKSEINCNVKLFPYLNLLDELIVNFQSRPQLDGNRQINIVGTEYKVIGYEHDFDGFETSLKLREA